MAEHLPMQEFPAKTAAGVGCLQLDELQTRDRAQQLPRLAAHAEVAQTMAAVVPADARREATGCLRHAALHEELAQFEGLLGEAFGALPQGRIVREELRVVVDLRRTRTRGSDQRVDGLTFARGDHGFCERARRRRIAAVAERLAAAGRGRVDDDFTAQMLEQLRRGEADRRPALVDEAGGVEGNAFTVRTRRAGAGSVGRVHRDGSCASIVITPSPLVPIRRHAPSHPRHAGRAATARPGTGSRRSRRSSARSGRAVRRSV